MTTFQLAGIPSEVVNSVASVLCRMAFEIGLWSNGGIHMLVVCEEAHRYVPADPVLGFVPTRQAIARIAKEGRKYGVSLGIITQRPGELDPTILSQCSTVFAMRLSNDRDQEIIRSAIPNSSISTTSFISSIGNGEAIAFGEAVAVPMRMRFTRVDEKNLPKANGVGVKATDETPDTVDLRSVVASMRALNGPDISSFQQAYSASHRHARAGQRGPGLHDFTDEQAAGPSEAPTDERDAAGYRTIQPGHAAAGGGRQPAARAFQPDPQSIAFGGPTGPAETGALPDTSAACRSKLCPARPRIGPSPTVSAREPLEKAAKQHHPQVAAV